MMRGFIGLALCSVAPLCVFFSIVQNHMLLTGVLNTKDMPPFVGTESGTVSEYLLNVWHWDGMLMLFMIAALPCLIIGICLLLNEEYGKYKETANSSGVADL